MLKRGAAVLAVVLALLAPAGAQPGPKAIALTFDDLPGVLQRPSLAALEDINVRLLASLRISSVPAVGFVNERGIQVEGELDARIALLRRWLDAGMALGNHTFSHPDLNDTPLPVYGQDIVQGERVTRPLLEGRGQQLVWFRHPFTHTGSTPAIKAELAQFLRDRGYRVAPFTIESADYAFAAVYERAIARRDAAGADRVMRAYLDHQDVMLAWADALARETFGRAIPQILLAHVNRLNADAMPETLRRLRAQGYMFVTLDRAMQDEAYASPDEYVGANGPSWLHRWRVGLKQPSRMREEPDPPGWVLQAFNEG